MTRQADAIIQEVRAFGLRLPGAHSKSPWPDHDDLAVNDKTFAYLPKSGGDFSIAVKLPYTGSVVLGLPFAQPTGYGLGRSFWVTIAPPADRLPAFDQLKEWVEESYRAQASRKLVRELDAREASNG